MSENQSKNAVAEKAEITPQQLQKRKKMIVFPLLILVFSGCMWLIFAPSEKPQEQGQDGFNTILPTPVKSNIIADKREAYLQEAMRAKEQEKVRSLQDFAFSLDEENAAREQTALQSEDNYSDERSYVSESHNDAFQSSASAYKDINRQLGSFYDDPALEDQVQTSELQSRIEELERQLSEEQGRKSSEAEQLALIEKSYQIAARYMNTGAQPASNSAVTVQPTTGITSNAKAVVQPIAQVRHNEVSLLAAPLPDSVFVEAFTKPRNWGFNTIGEHDTAPQKNSIRACVYQTIAVTDGQQICLRLQEPMMAGSQMIPANTIVTGTARISGERLGIAINAVQYAGNVIPIELLVYDLDGNEGISVPGSEEINAVKEIAANMGSGMGSSITITDDASTQLLSDLGRSAIQGVSQYVGKKMRTVKVTLKAGYRVLLLPPLK